MFFPTNRVFLPSGEVRRKRGVVVCFTVDVKILQINKEKMREKSRRAGKGNLSGGRRPSERGDHVDGEKERMHQGDTDCHQQRGADFKERHQHSEMIGRNVSAVSVWVWRE
ncbi:hypothetical protein E2C01_043036 [Portunus trituberculatus]|uniref:Uncharacterized protein n=1 Tax=Portunus trituberculatus TaxID=210409 RepID=A0A5B7FV92_PORTR|nr:hypothetical protein [Portunus trituberculatus]